MYTITVDSASKDFREVHALDHVSCAFTSGKIHGLIGRNGSGKTMLLKCICGLMGLSAGVIEVDGVEIHAERRLPVPMGVIIENPGFLPHLSGLENLKLLASIRRQIDVEQIRATLHVVGLDPALRRPVGKYSLGMRQRLGLAQAIMEDPPILLLDEPFNGLDNRGVEEMRLLLQNMKTKGKTIVIASHNPLDIDMLCDAVYSMDSGKLECVKALQEEGEQGARDARSEAGRIAAAWRGVSPPPSFQKQMASMIERME